MVTKSIKLPGPTHPITIEPTPARVTVTVAGRVIADTFERASEFLSLAAASADLKHEHQRAAAR